MLLKHRGCRITYDFSTCRPVVERHLKDCGLIPDALAITNEIARLCDAMRMEGVDPESSEGRERLGPLREAFERDRDELASAGGIDVVLGPDGLPERVIKSTSIGFRHFRTLDADEIASFLQTWLSRGTFNVTAGQAEYVLNSVGELFVNGFNHAESPIGVVSFGQFFPKLKTLKLVVMDLGIGIPESIRRRLARQYRSGWLQDGPALEWAFEKGHTSSRDPRGLGLAIMRDFIVNNSGTLEVYSLNGYGSISGSSLFVTRSVTFPGTAVEISLGAMHYAPPPLAEIAF